MLKRILLAVATLIAAFAVPAASAAEEASSGIAAILRRGEVRIALPAFDSPPFFAVGGGGGLQGFDIGMAEAIGRELGVAVRFDRRARTFDEVVEIVARGEADIAICKLSRTLRRAQKVRFTQPYASFRHALVVNRVRFAEIAEGRDALEVMHDFRGSLGVIANSSFAEYARINFPDAEIRLFPSWTEVVGAVREGRVAAAYRDEFEIKKMIVEDPALSLTLRTISLTDLTDTLGMAVAANEAQLVAFLDMFLAQRIGLKSADDMLALVPAPLHVSQGSTP